MLYSAFRTVRDQYEFSAIYTPSTYAPVYLPTLCTLLSDLSEDGVLLSFVVLGLIAARYLGQL